MSDTGFEIASVMEENGRATPTPSFVQQQREEDEAVMQLPAASGSDLGLVDEDGVCDDHDDDHDGAPSSSRRRLSPGRFDKKKKIGALLVLSALCALAVGLSVGLSKRNDGNEVRSSKAIGGADVTLTLDQCLALEEEEEDERMSGDENVGDDATYTPTQFPTYLPTEDNEIEQNEFGSDDVIDDFFPFGDDGIPEFQQGIQTISNDMKVDFDGPIRRDLRGELRREIGDSTPRSLTSKEKATTKRLGSNESKKKRERKLSEQCDALLADYHDSKSSKCSGGSSSKTGKSGGEGSSKTGKSGGEGSSKGGKSGGEGGGGSKSGKACDDKPTNAPTTASTNSPTNKPTFAPTTSPTNKPTAQCTINEGFQVAPFSNCNQSSNQLICCQRANGPECVNPPSSCQSGPASNNACLESNLGTLCSGATPQCCRSGQTGNNGYSCIASTDICPTD